MYVSKNKSSHRSMMQLNIESESYATSSVCSQDFPNELQAVSIGRRTSIGPSFGCSANSAQGRTEEQIPFRSKSVGYFVQLETIRNDLLEAFKADAAA